MNQSTSELAAAYALNMQISSPLKFGGVHAQGEVASAIVKAPTWVVRVRGFDSVWKTSHFESRWRLLDQVDYVYISFFYYVFSFI